MSKDDATARITEQQVLDRLRGIPGPDGSSDLVTLRLISGIAIRDGRVSFAVEVPPARAAALEPLRRAAQQAVETLPGVRSVAAVLTASRAAAAPPQAAATGSDPAIGGIRTFVAVASGKGGVGKSTTAANLAVALAGIGLRVGLLDADIFGPSQPRLMGVSGKPRPAGNNLMTPLEAHGVKIMSIGFLVPEETAMIWRGPMVMGALKQLLSNVDWGPLDIMVVDMPPGTGDAQLTLAQSVPLAGAVIVSTPQDLALIDARRGIAMFEKVQVPTLGLVENMSYFVCPHCGGRTDIFSHGGAADEAARLGVPFLGAVPLDIRIRETSDAGTPIVVAEPASAHTAAYRSAAEQVWAAVGGARRAAPRIVVDD